MHTYVQSCANEAHPECTIAPLTNGNGIIRARIGSQEPENAHSHLLSMVLGNTETVPVSGGEIVTGTWQSIILVELDGPRKRTVGVQVVGRT